LLSKLIELFYHFGLDVDAHVFAALHEQRLIDQIAQGVLLAVFDIGAQLLRCALALALLLASSSAAARALSNSERVMISLLTRAMISSTVLLGTISAFFGSAGFLASGFFSGSGAAKRAFPAPALRLIGLLGRRLLGSQRQSGAERR